MITIKNRISPLSKYARFNLLIGLCLLIPGLVTARSVHRPKDPLMPSISVGFQDTQKTFSLTNPHLEEYALFRLFEPDFFYEHLLPDRPVEFRNNAQKTVDGKELSRLIEQLLSEIKEKKKHYSNFTVLKKPGFNRRKAAGLVIAKFNDFPFVVKLFIETPESFVNPWAKGFEPIFFFYMGGGVNRHLSGFTRIKNLEYIKNKIDNDPKWTNVIDVPRKWYWLPEQTPWLTITGKNIGNKPEIKTRIPGTYAIVADAIDQERGFSWLNSKDMDIALEVTHFLENNLDLQITNFMVEKESNKIVIIDTEHFPTMVGVKHPLPMFNGYLSWYAHLIERCGREMIFCTKKDWRNAQKINVDSLAPF